MMGMFVNLVGIRDFGLIEGLFEKREVAMIATADFGPEDAGHRLHNDLSPLEWCSAEAVLKAHQVYLKTIANMILPPRVKVKKAPSDIVQDVSLIAFVKFSRFKGRTAGELQAWLEGILRHKCMQAYRDVMNRGEISLDSISAASGFSSTTVDMQDHSTPEPQQQASRNELRNIVRAAILRLPVKLGVVLLMKWEEGLTIVEAARRLGIDKSAAQRRYERGMAKLQTMPELKRLLN